MLFYMVYAAAGENGCIVDASKAIDGCLLILYILQQDKMDVVLCCICFSKNAWLLFNIENAEAESYVFLQVGCDKLLLPSSVGASGKTIS